MNHWDSITYILRLLEFGCQIFEIDKFRYPKLKIMYALTSWLMWLICSEIWFHTTISRTYTIMSFMLQVCTWYIKLSWRFINFVLLLFIIIIDWMIDEDYWFTTSHILEEVEYDIMTLINVEILWICVYQQLCDVDYNNSIYICICTYVSMCFPCWFVAQVCNGKHILWRLSVDDKLCSLPFIHALKCVLHNTIPDC